MANLTLAGWGSESTCRQGLWGAGAQGWPPALLLVRPQRARSRQAGGLQASRSSQGVPTKVPMLTQEKTGVLPGILRVVATAFTPFPGWPCKPKCKHKSCGVWDNPRQSKSQGPYCDYAEWIMAGSALFHVPSGKETVSRLDSGHYCRTYTRHISPFCVFKCSPCLVFVTIKKKMH